MGQNEVLEALFGALRPLVVAPVVLVVGLDLGNGHEEGLCLVAHIQEFQGHVVDAVRPVALEIDAPVVFVKDIAVVAVGGELQHVRDPPVAGVAAPQLPGHGGHGVVHGVVAVHVAVAGQMPLAHIRRLVAGLLQIVRQRFDVGGQHDVVAEAAGVGGVTAGLEQRAAGAAHRLGREGVVELHALPGQPVQIRSDVQRLAEAAAGIPALLIGEIKNDVVCHGITTPYYNMPVLSRPAAAAKKQTNAQSVGFSGVFFIITFAFGGCH